MYYEEKIVNGVLCWRNSPRGEWTPRTIEELSTQVVALQSRLSLAEKVVEAAEALLPTLCGVSDEDIALEQAFAAYRSAK